MTKEETREYFRKRSAELTSQGRCVACKEKLPEGDTHTKCQKCREREYAYQKARRQLLRDMNRCVRCGVEKPDDGHYMCEGCRAEHRAEYKQRTAMGLCANCGGLLDDKHYVNCSKCRAASRAAQRRYVYGGTDV